MKNMYTTSLQASGACGEMTFDDADDISLGLKFDEGRSLDNCSVVSINSIKQ